MRKKLLPLLIALAALISFSSCSEAPVMPEPMTSSTPKLEKPAIGENYYGHINFEFLSKGQMPHGKTGAYGTMSNLNDAMLEYVSDLIDRCAESTPESGSLEEIIKEMYQQYLDVDARNKAGIDVLMPLLGMIEACETPDELVNAMAAAYTNYGVKSFISLKVNPNHVDASENILYMMNYNSMGHMKENFTKTDNGSEEMGNFIESVLCVLNVKPEEAKERAKKAVKMVNEIMKASFDIEDTEIIENHFNIYGKNKLNALLSNIDTDKMFRAFGINPKKIIVYDVSQAKKINEFMTKEYMRELKDYVIACVGYEYSDMFPLKYSDKISKIGNFEKNPEKSAKSFVAKILEEELGVVYGREICTKEVMDFVEKMVGDIKDSCRNLIKNCKRLGDDSKEKYISKLDNMVVLLGYNDNIEVPYIITPAKEGGDMLSNCVAVKSARARQNLAELEQKVNRETWGMSAIETNAVYNPLVNTFTIPAVIMSKPFMDPAWGEYKNLGMLGYIVAHEMSHAFDSKGFKFNEIGTYSPERINEEDQEKYRELMKRVENYYNNYKLLDVYNINGVQTLSENIADLAAVQCILGIAHSKEECKEIFEGIAEQWASLELLTDLILTLESDVHSPGEARVNAVVSSMDQFYEVYDIKETDKMYVAPEDRVKVW